MKAGLTALAVAASFVAAACGGSSTGGTGGSAGSGGQGATAGSGGTGGGPAGPRKLDVLLVVDNSISMGDKQAHLAQSLPSFFQRLINPRCVDSGGKPTGESHPCPAGSQVELEPARDLHVGVITSSLGSLGGETCSSGAVGQDDKGRLIPAVRAGLSSHEGQGFLAWDSQANPQASLSEFVDSVRSHVNAVGETGCGYESPLEAMYRFLIDPQPPDAVVKEGSFTTALRCQGEGLPCGANGTCINTFCADNVVLAQRQSFLRPDSTVVVVLLSDENDCSLRADGQSWLMTLASTGLPAATPACETDPDSPLCTSCGVGGSGCEGQTHPSAADHLNLRCWEQKRRFGADFLYPPSRYVEGLKSPTITGRDGAPTWNPLFATGGGVSRDPSLVLLATIVGVPWQLIAHPASVAPGEVLAYQHATQIDWSQLTKNGHTPAGSVYMHESNAPRWGLPTFATPNADAIVGHDWDIAAAGGSSGPGDLQFACIFPLIAPRDCASVTGGCDCSVAGVYGQSPLCWSGTEFSSVQHYAKAYPGLRQLEVVRDTMGVAASICPKSNDSSTPGYGYHPAFDAIIERLR
ncbi:MAG: hypothetical protein KF718_12930 [Polyangiaceae bacterium]|nr:hypothetical protein [Polyangiaceae bacterium]